MACLFHVFDRDTNPRKTSPIHLLKEERVKCKSGFHFSSSQTAVRRCQGNLSEATGRGNAKRSRPLIACAPEDKGEQKTRAEQGIHFHRILLIPPHLPLSSLPPEFPPETLRFTTHSF